MDRLTACARSGLSPRARGNLVGLQHVGERRGTIPACAGEPLNAMATGTQARDYPRVRGGTHFRPNEAEEGLGLSPRARGNH